MPNSHNLYNFSSIVDFVDDAIIAYASTPVAAGPCDFSCIQQVVGFGKALLGGRRFDRKQPAKTARERAFKSRSAARSRRTSCTRPLLLEKILELSEFERLAPDFFEHF